MYNGPLTPNVACIQECVFYNKCVKWLRQRGSGISWIKKLKKALLMTSLEHKVYRWYPNKANRARGAVHVLLLLVIGSVHVGTLSAFCYSTHTQLSVISNDLLFRSNPEMQTQPELEPATLQSVIECGMPNDFGHGTLQDYFFKTPPNVRSFSTNVIYYRHYRWHAQFIH